MLYGSLEGRGVWGEWVRVAEPLHRPPETITAVFISCTPMQNKKCKLKKMTIIKKSTNNKCWRKWKWLSHAWSFATPWTGESREWGTLLHCWWECELARPLWRTARRVLKTLKTELPWDPAIPLLGTSGENDGSQRYTHPSAHCTTAHNSQDTEAA